MSEDKSEYKSQIITPPERKSVAKSTPRQDMVEIDPNQMVMVAIQAGYDPQYLSMIMEERAKLVAEQARKEFFAALARFQQHLPEIERGKPVYNKDGKSIRYWYAPTEQIVKQIKDPLGECGLSYRTETELIDKPERDYKQWVKAKVIVYHEAGHNEPTEFEIPVVKSDFMTYAQSVKSARTDANRIAICNALGIVTADPDEDGNDVPGVNEVHRVMAQLKEFGVENAPMLRHINAKNWGDISDKQLEKLDAALKLLREGATVRQVFGASGAAAALDADDTAPTPADVFAMLDRATTEEELLEAVDLGNDVLESKGHQRIGEQKRKEAERRIKGKGGGKKKAGKKTESNGAEGAFGG